MDRDIERGLDNLVLARELHDHYESVDAAKPGGWADRRAERDADESAWVERADRAARRRP